MKLRRTSGKKGRCRETSLKVVAQGKRFLNKAHEALGQYSHTHVITRLHGNLGSPSARHDMPPADLDALYAQLRRRMVETGEWDR